MKLKSAAAVTAAAFEWLSDKEAGFFFGRTEAWLCSFRWTFTRLPQLRLSPLPVSYETHRADAPHRPPLIGRRCSSLTSWAAAAAAAAASRHSRPVVGQVHVCVSEHRRGCAACLLSPPHLHNMSCRGEESKIGGTASRNSVIGIYIWLRTLFTLSGARRPSTRNVIFTSRDAERCQLLSPSHVYFYLFIFLSAAHLFHETPLRRRESWRRTRRLSSHDQLKKKPKKTWRDCRAVSTNFTNNIIICAHTQDILSRTQDHTIQSHPIQQSKEDSRESTHIDSHRRTDCSDTRVTKRDFSR